MFKTFLNIFTFSRIIKLPSSPNTLTNPLPSNPSTQVEPEMMRLSKLVSQQSVCSRREAEKLISLGLIRVNGHRIYQNTLVPVNHELKVFTQKGVRREIPVIKLWMMNKPRGCICTEKDPEKRQTIYQLLPPQFKTLGHIMSIGRLDFNSEGLLLLTNNNDLKNILENPETCLHRLYRVKVHGRVTEQKLQSMRRGCTISGIHYEPFKVSVIRQLSKNVWLYIQIKQGKNREIRKVLQKHDLQVSKLIRVQYGPYKLGSLRSIKELQILPRFKRQIQKRMINQITGGRENKSLIEVQLRPEAIEMAKLQKKPSQIAEETSGQRRRIQSK